MPKRSCPFSRPAPLQLKTRVGLRELSRGVRGEEYRREIYERTRQLLFRGARAYMEGAWPASPAATAAAARWPGPGPGGEAQQEGVAGRRWSGQLVIGQGGKLLQGPAAGKVAPAGASKACSSCVRTADVKEACAQCERFVCRDCGRLCSSCNALACSFCSTVDYGDVGEQVLCNGCSIFPV
ncbi:apoptosis regulatory protein Siva [Apus apus]|uniref:apoptosis regulatory protein Siva n=1 Tax=Apus apus TaxID=8895 RepID=UPI0021F866BE|nr:apoptosis regulatory protein Siva [Apus apus]